MKKLLFFIIACWPGIYLCAQIEPVLSGEQTLKALSVKKVTSFYFNTTDTLAHDGRLILEKEFDIHGKTTKKYLLSLWEAVSYSNTTTFEYNEDALLSGETIIQTILNLEKRDDDYINAFGETPLHEKIRYTYNSEGQLSEKEIFTYSTPEFIDTVAASQTILYSYENGLLQKEQSSSPNQGMFNQNFTIEYTYDLKQNLSSKTMNYGVDLGKNRITEYWYDESNRISEEKITDTGISRNNGHFKYEYNEAGQLKTKLEYDALVADFVPDISYTYNQQGNRISGEVDVVFQYYENGLIRSELWKDAISDQLFFFVSSYEYR